MKNYYDIAIIGGGIGGLMTAYRLTENDPSGGSFGNIRARYIIITNDMTPTQRNVTRQPAYIPSRRTCNDRAQSK